LVERGFRLAGSEQRAAGLAAISCAEARASQSGLSPGEALPLGGRRFFRPVAISV
jgi:hypothetical protein